MVFCTNPAKIRKKIGTRGERLFAVQDATIAAAYAQLAADSLGLSSVWIGRFYERQLQNMLKTKLRPVAILSIGYPNEKPHPKKSKKQDKLIKRI